MQDKKCSKCETIRPLTDYFNNAKSLDGKKAECKVCSKLRKKEFREKYPERVREQEKKTKENRKDSIKREQSEYFQKNKEKIYKRHNEWVKNNPDKVKKYMTEQKRIAKNLRHELSRIYQGRTKFPKVELLELLGCSPEFYREYIQSKFSPGMSFDNYGEWHIDHIIPCSSFDMNNHEQQKLCFHYSNTQPLWRIDNIRKSNR